MELLVTHLGLRNLVAVEVVALMVGMVTMVKAFAAAIHIYGHKVVAKEHMEAVVVRVIESIAMVVEHREVLEPCELSGPEILVHSHQLTQEMCNGTIY
jgi:hypothetical protein